MIVMIVKVNRMTHERWLRFERPWRCIHDIIKEKRVGAWLEERGVLDVGRVSSARLSFVEMEEEDVVMENVWCGIHL
ncbi:hypothetical protein Tco_0078241 [Tanacetum coccineum]